MSPTRLCAAMRRTQWTTASLRIARVTAWLLALGLALALPARMAFAFDDGSDRIEDGVDDAVITTSISEVGEVASSRAQMVAVAASPFAKVPDAGPHRVRCDAPAARSSRWVEPACRSARPSLLHEPDDSGNPH